MDAAPLIALLVVVLGVLLWRAISRGRGELARFRRLRSTRARQKVYRRWLVESVLVIGGLGVVTAFGAWSYVDPLLAEAQSLAPVAAVRGMLATELGAGVGLAAAVALLAFLVIPPFLLRRVPLEEVTAIGDIRPLLPRTRGELPYGVGLALSAGVFEELLLRLAVPALLFGITGDALWSFGIAVLVFGVLHLYQGPAGIAVTTLVGALLTALYVVTGSLLWPIVLHALLDLRSLVLIPALLGTAWAPRAPTPST